MFNFSSSNALFLIINLVGTIRWFMLAGMTRTRTVVTLANDCPPRPSGNTRVVADLKTDYIHGGLRIVSLFLSIFYILSFYFWSNVLFHFFFRNKDKPGGQHRMNIWHGHFPYENTADDGFPFTAPVSIYIYYLFFNFTPMRLV